MAEQAYAYVTLIPVAKGFQREVAKQMDGVGGAGGQAGQLAGGNFNKRFTQRLKVLATSAAVTAGAAAVGRVIGNSIAEASALEESINAVNVVFEDSAAGILEIGEAASKSLGLSNTEFNAAAVQFSSFAQKIAGEGGDVVGTIDDLATRGADFASVMNLEVSQALSVFQSGLAGETEPLKQFGIDLSAAAVETFALENGIVAAGESMTEQQKVQARYGALMEQTAKTSGDFANTSGGLANQQRILGAEFTNLQASIGSALVPVMEDLLGIVRNNVLPAFEDFGNWLESPQGVTAVQGLSTVVSGLAGFLINVTAALVEQLPLLGALAAAYFANTIRLAAQTAATGAATAAQLALNAAMASNPIGLLLTGLALAVVGVTAFANANKDATPTQEELNQSIEDTKEELKFYREEQEKSANSSKLYDSKIRELEKSLDEQRAALQESYNWTQKQKDASYEARDAALANRVANQNLKPSLVNSKDGFNDLAFAAINAKLGVESLTIAEEAQRLMEEQSKLPDHLHTYKSYEQILAEVTAKTRFQTQAQADFDEKVKQTAIDLGLVVPGLDDMEKKTTSAIQPAEKLTEVIERQNEALENAKTNYADAVETAQKQFKQAQQRISDDYNQTIERATLQRDNAIADALDGYTQRVDQINERFAQRQADIVQKSMDRLRDVYRNVTAVDVADVFGQDDVGDIGGLISSLTGRLEASQNLVENSGELAGAGFSQTFIEQVVGAGTAVGNEMARAILNATPEQQLRLQELFAMIQREANTGMDALAETLYEKNGLATEQLNLLYENVLIEQTEALAEQEQNYNETMASIMERFNESIAEAKEERDEALVDAKLTLEAALVAANEAFLESLEEIDEEFKEKIKEMKSEVSSLSGDISSLQGKISNLRSKASSALADAQAAVIAGNAALGSGGSPEAFADGGFVTGPVNALVGEAGPEVIMPLDRFERAMGLESDGGKTLNYYAAPNESMDSESELFSAMRRAKVVANW